jgi:Taurine catabolism dioxygenase TauD, TfdA family
MSFRTRPGDLVAWNNRRMFHGRTEFGFTKSDAVRRLLGCYVSIDDFEIRTRTLCREYGGIHDLVRTGIQNDA